MVADIEDGERAVEEEAEEEGGVFGLGVVVRCCAARGGVGCPVRCLCLFECGDHGVPPAGFLWLVKRRGAGFCVEVREVARGWGCLGGFVSALGDRRLAPRLVHVRSDREPLVRDRCWAFRGSDVLVFLLALQWAGARWYPGLSSCSARSGRRLACASGSGMAGWRDRVRFRRGRRVWLEAFWRSRGRRSRSGRMGLRGARRFVVPWRCW